LIANADHAIFITMARPPQTEIRIRLVIENPVAGDRYQQKISV